MSDSTIRIPLSKTSKKYAGQYEAIVSIEDAVLAGLNWSVSHARHTIYAYRHTRKNIGAKSISLHREVIKRKLGEDVPDNVEIDHIDGNGLNNTRDNLRLATPQENKTNVGKPKHNTSGYKGVSWDKRNKKWRAIVRVNGKPKDLGRFVTIEEADKVCREARDKYHGEFANHGE